MPNVCPKQDYLQGFGSKGGTYKMAVNMFKCMKRAEKIYEEVLYKTSKNQLGHIPTVVVSSVKTDKNTP